MVTEAVEGEQLSPANEPAQEYGGDREGGVISIHRQLMSSAVWTLTDGQRVVFLTLLMVANWRPSKVSIGGREVTIRRGQALIATRTLAEKANVSRIVARRAIRNLQALGVIRWEPAVSSPEESRAPHVVTLLNYDAFQLTPGFVKKGSEPRTSPERAQSEPDQNKGNKGNTTTKAAPASPAAAQVSLLPQPEKLKTHDSRRSEASAVKDPRQAPTAKLLFEAFGREREGAVLDFDGTDGRALRFFLGRNPQLTPTAIAERWVRCLRDPRGTVKVRTFLSQWNSYATAQPPGGKRKVIAPVSDFTNARAEDFYS